MGNMALWFIGIMLGIIVVHLIHIKMYLRAIHISLEAACDRMYGVTGHSWPTPPPVSSAPQSVTQVHAH
jgi:hypothetical protein